ncbi:MAG: hypothetical protein ACE5JP_04425 [Candidatus Bipolaricaulia bacterium]
MAELETLKDLIASDPNYEPLIQMILEQPYIERHHLEAALDLPAEDLGSMLDRLGAGMIVLELTSQADSNVESRVPKRVYLVNPEIESAVRELL